MKLWSFTSYPPAENLVAIRSGSQFRNSRPWKSWRWPVTITKNNWNSDKIRTMIGSWNRYLCSFCRPTDDWIEYFTSTAVVMLFFNITWKHTTRTLLLRLQLTADAALAAVYELCNDTVRSQIAPFQAAPDNDYTRGTDHSSRSRRGRSCDGKVSLTGEL